MPAGVRFVEQGESLEEAVRREVWEEAGIAVGAVRVVGSQPWPIGRGGSCELMLGCVARATDDAIDFDRDEMCVHPGVRPAMGA